jgi:hypothetical protein
MKRLLVLCILLLSSCAALERSGERLAAEKEGIIAAAVAAAKDVAGNPTLANAALELGELIAYIGSVAFGLGGTAVVMRNRLSNKRKDEIEHRLEVVEGTLGAKSVEAAS